MYHCNEINEKMTMALAHEVKNPVSLIKAHIELLELDKELSGYKSNINIIKRELNKISDIISDFMLFYKPENSIKEINIIPIIKEIMERFKIYSKKNIKFSLVLECNKDEFNINLQDIKISMLFNNIYKNAVESIKNKEGHIITKIYILNNRPTIDIIDDGEGLKNHSLQDIKKPFVTYKKGGTGFGIVICESILNDIGGKFEIFNNKDKGCTVRLTF